MLIFFNNQLLTTCFYEKPNPEFWIIKSGLSNYLFLLFFCCYCCFIKTISLVKKCVKIRNLKLGFSWYIACGEQLTYFFFVNFCCRIVWPQKKVEAQFFFVFVFLRISPLQNLHLNTPNDNFFIILRAIS